MELTCSKCGNIIPATHINVGTDLAKCDYCNSMHKASELIDIREEKTLAKPPKASLIKLKEGMGDNFSIHLPAGGFKIQYLFLAIFILFWLSFISVWTWLAIQGSLFFALFSIPFWLVGLSMLNNFLNAILEVQEINLKGNRLTLLKKRVFQPKEYSFDLADIHDIRMNPIKTHPLLLLGNIRFMSKARRSYRTNLKFPSILTGEKSLHFFESANDAEQEWVTAFLEIKRKKVKQR